MVGFAPFVIIVSSDPYLLGAGKVVVSGEDGGRWAGFVHQGYRKESLGAGASSKVDPVKIREGVEDRIYFVPMHPTEIVDWTVTASLDMQPSSQIRAMPPLVKGRSVSSTLKSA